MYPMVKEGVSIGTFEDDDSGVTHYYIENSNGDEFEISHRLWLALLDADGTKPLDLPDQGKRILSALKRHNLIQTSRFVRDKGILNHFIIFPFSNKFCGNPACKVINAVLPVVAILVLFLGVCFKICYGAPTGYDFNWWLYYGFAVVSLALHEAGHLVACLAFGFKVRDTGILLLGIIPIGAYVEYDNKPDAPWKEKMQLSLAGVEVNLLLAGICLLLSISDYPLSFTMTSVAKLNVVLAGINLLPAPGIDGELALSALFGVNSISEIAKEWLADKKRRKKLRHSGFPGCICLCIFFFTRFAKVLIWLLIAINIISVFINLFWTFL